MDMDTLGYWSTKIPAPIREVRLLCLVIAVEGIFAPLLQIVDIPTNNRFCDPNTYHAPNCRSNPERTAGKRKR